VTFVQVRGGFRPEFAAEAHRQSALAGDAERASDDMDLVEAVSDDWDE
jgi:Protein  of unknown function (DUF3018)